MQDEVNQKVVTLCITGGKISAEYKSRQTAERTCVLSWETEHGKADEAELPAYQYRSDGWEYQVI